MLIKQHDNGFHYVHFYDGKRSRTLSLRTKCSTEAHRMAHKRISEVEIKREHTVTPTVGLILEAYWLNHGANLPSHKTVRRIIGTLTEAFGEMPPQMVTPNAVKRYVRQRDKAQGTIRRELGVLQAAFNYVVRKGGKLRPEVVPVIDIPPMAKPRDRWCTWEQLDHLQATAASMRIGDRLSRAERFLAIAIASGARKTAIQELTWDAIDFKSKLIDFTRSQPVASRTKRRVVTPISDDLLPVLKRAYSERQGNHVLDNTGCVKSVLARVTRAAGLPWCSPHVLRHSFASLAAMAGVPLLEVARVLGNTIGVVESTYAKHTPGYLRSAVNFRRR